MGEVSKSSSTLWQKAKPVYTPLGLMKTEASSQNSEAFLHAISILSENGPLTHIVTHIHFDAMLSISQRMIGMNQRIVGEDGF